MRADPEHSLGEATLTQVAPHLSFPAGLPRCSESVQAAFSTAPYGDPVRCSFVLLLLISACRRSSEALVEPGPLAVRCVPVSVEKLVRTVSLRGVVEVAPAHHAVVAAQTAGRLTVWPGRCP